MSASDELHDGEGEWLAEIRAARPEVPAGLSERVFYELEAPIARVCTVEVPIPYAAHLEQAALPSVARIVAAAREVCGAGAS